MDRTKEFWTIVQATEIPQPGPEPRPFYADLHAKHQQIKRLLEELGRLTPYESFRMQPLVEQGHRLVREYREMPIDDGSTGDAREMAQTLRGIVRTNALRATLRLNEAARSSASHQRSQAAAEGAVAPRALDEQQAMAAQTSALLQEEGEGAMHTELVQERRRIVRSISEIGQIVEDISIHVGLQEEQLRRIDDSMMHAEKWNRKTLAELRGLWETVSGNRKNILRFFGIWIIIFTLFWLIKR